MFIIYVILPSRFWKKAITIEVKSGKSYILLAAKIARFSKASKHTINALVALLNVLVVLKRSSSKDP
jgi:hypothetical protein